MPAARPATEYTTNTPAKCPDAFSLLKQGAAAQRTCVLHATLRPDPLMHVAWSSCGATVVDDGWTAKVKLKVAPKVELVLRQIVASAVAPGSAPPTIHPAAATLHGLGLGALKSALQKQSSEINVLETKLRNSTSGNNALTTKI